MTEAATRTRMSRAERREQLLDVTKAVVGEQGFHTVSIEAVARRAGITRPVVYGHFEDLGHLLTAMLERESARALAQLVALLPTDPDGDRPGALLAALGAYLEAVRADPVTWRLVLMPQEGAPELLRERIGSGRDAIVAALAEVVRPGGSPDPELTARLLSAAADELARLLLTRPEDFPVERLTGLARWVLERLGA